MKKFFLSVVLALATLTISAQEKVFLDYGVAEEPIERVVRDRNFAIKLGAGVSNLLGTDAYAAVSYKLAFSYDCRLVKGLYLIPEIDFVVKGSSPVLWGEKLDLFYLQVPICLAWKFRLNDNVNFGIKAGPYASVGLVGSDVTWDGKNKSDVFNPDYGSNRFDAGVLAGVHLDFYAFTLGVEYSHGFIMLNKEYTPLNGCNYAVGATFGVRF